MKRLIIPSILVPIVLVLLIGISTANAQLTNEPAAPQSGYSIDWYTIDGGGATFSAGGGYSLGGSIGQPDAGSLSGGLYTLNGGFWGGSSINTSNIYLPLVLKNYSPPAIPAAPGPLTVTVLSPTTLNVAWNDNSLNEDGFHLEQSINGGAFSTLPSIAGSITTGVVITTITGLSPNTLYTYRARAYNGGGNSTYSNSASGTTPSSLTIPAAPSGLVVTGLYPDMTELHWTNNANNANTFGIDLSTDDGATWWTGTHAGAVYGDVSVDYTTVWDDQRTPNTQYCYRVRAENAAGNSAWTSKVCATTPSLPTVNAPSNLNATFVSGVNVALTWQDNSNNEDGFRIETSYDGGAYNAYILPITVTQNSTSVTIAEPNVGHNYKFHVRAFNAYATSGWSNESNVNVPAGSLTGARFTNNTSYYVVSLFVDGAEKLPQNSGGAIAPGGSLQLNLGVGSHPYTAITGNWNGSYRNDLWYYPGGSGTLNVNVTSGNVIQVPAFVNPTITHLLSDPEGQGRTYTVWLAQTGTPYVHMCFVFNSNGTYQFRGVSGNWSAVSNYWLVSYPGNLYVTFQPNSFPYGYLSEISITQPFPNPFFNMTQGGTVYRYEYQASNTCP
jgi:hypothetical protein